MIFLEAKRTPRARMRKQPCNSLLRDLDSAHHSREQGWVVFRSHAAMALAEILSAPLNHYLPHSARMTSPFLLSAPPPTCQSRPLRRMHGRPSAHTPRHKALPIRPRVCSPLVSTARTVPFEAIYALRLGGISVPLRSFRRIVRPNCRAEDERRSSRAGESWKRPLDRRRRCTLGLSASELA